MKRMLPILSAVAMLAACNNSAKTSADAPAVAPVTQQAPAYNPDTVGLAQFQQWKAQHELADAKAYQPSENVSAAPVRKATKVYYVPVQKETRATPVVTNDPSPVSNSTNSNPSTTDESGTMSSESSNTAKASVKKGWSKAAKGAVIGGAGGAVAGAVINKKNRAVGAVIGGVLGAGGGYAIGHGMDKKDGRY